MFALKRARPSSRCVMGCHVLHAPGAYPAVLSGMRAAISGRCCGYSARVLRLCVFGIGISFRACFVRHSPPPACRSGGTLIRAYPARAPAPVGAPRREPDAGRNSPVGRIGGFFAPARTAKRSSSADAASFLRPNIAHDSDISIIITELLLNIHEQIIIAGRPGAPISRERPDKRANAFLQRIEVAAASGAEAASAAGKRVMARQRDCFAPGNGIADGVSRPGAQRRSGRGKWRVDRGRKPQYPAASRCRRGPDRTWRQNATQRLETPAGETPLERRPDSPGRFAGGESALTGRSRRPVADSRREVRPRGRGGDATIGTARPA